MMKSRLALIATGIALAALLGGCPGVQLPGTTGTDGSTDGNDSTTEYMILPESVSLDVDEIDVTEETGQAAPALTYLEVGQQQSGITLAQLDEIMDRFAQINALVTGPGDVQIQDTIIWDTRVSGAVGGPGGARVPNPGSGTGGSRDIKIDFSAFDFDGDGTADGSGTPTTAPVALRVWVTDASGVYQPAACGLIEVLPTSTNPGQGKLHTLSYARNADGDVAIIQWDQDDPNDQLLETWDEHPEGGSWGYSSFMVHHKAVGSDLQKTVKSTINDEFVVVRYLDSATAAAVAGDRGSTFAALIASPPPINYYFLATGAAATAADAGGVALSGTGVLEPPDATIFPWPGTFPTTPTF